MIINFTSRYEMKSGQKKVLLEMLDEDYLVQII